MTTARELLQEALHYLGGTDAANDIARDIRAYLAQPEPEPVAWILRTGHGDQVHLGSEQPYPQVKWRGLPAWKPLYAAQPEPAAKPEPSAEVERVMELARKLYPVPQGIAQMDAEAALRAEVERLVRKHLCAEAERDEYLKAAELHKERAGAAEAEVMRLRKGGCARDQGLTQYCAEAANAIGIAQACEKLAEAAERDAERYRWLRSWVQRDVSTSSIVPMTGTFQATALSLNELDVSIDAAIAQEGP